MLPLRGCPRNVGERHLELGHENHFRAAFWKGNKYRMPFPALMDKSVSFIGGSKVEPRSLYSFVLAYVKD